MQMRKSILFNHAAWVKTTNSTELTPEARIFFYEDYLILAHSILSCSEFSKVEKGNAILANLIKMTQDVKLDKQVKKLAEYAIEYFNCNNNIDLLRDLALKNYFPAVCDVFQKYQQSSPKVAFFGSGNLPGLYYAAKLLLLALNRNNYKMYGYVGLQTYDQLMAQLVAARNMLQQSSNAVAGWYLETINNCEKTKMTVGSPDNFILQHCPAAICRDVKQGMLGKRSYAILGVSLTEQELGEFKEVGLGESLSPYTTAADDLLTEDEHNFDYSSSDEEVSNQQQSPRAMEVESVLNPDDPIEIFSDEVETRFSRRMVR